MVGDGGEMRGGSGDEVEVGSTRWDLFTLKRRGLVGIVCF